ncbi:MAG: tetratricopeptide repeat protein [Planctomycetota bacterium]
MSWRESPAGRLTVRADDLYDEGRHDEALDLIEQALRLRPRSVALETRRGRELHALGRYAEAEQVVRAALRINDRFVHAWNQLGMQYMDQGYFEKAAFCFQQSADIAPNESVLTGLANCQLVFDPAAALENAERALAIDPTWEEAERVRDSARRRLAE